MSPTLESPVRSAPVVVSFPGGQVVEAHYHGHSIPTDQPVRHGGGGSAPAPFDLFLASIATCAGFYALQFAQTRGLPTAGLEVSLEPVRGDDGKHFDLIRLTVTLPDGFPQKYRPALQRAIDQCAVKRHIVDPPRFEIELR
jgi:putative redox protein